jgi:hypothetical protein
MGEFERLTAAQLREAALALDEWVAEQRHRAEIEAEVLDEDRAQADRDRAERVRAVQVALEAEAARQEPVPSLR